MKALSVKQPWASQIASGEKTVECRSWNTHYRGELLICSSQTMEFCKKSRLYGQALVVVKVIDVYRMRQVDLYHACIPKHWHEKVLQGYAWKLEKLYEVIPFHVKGRLNFYEVNSELIQRITR